MRGRFASNVLIPVQASLGAGIFGAEWKVEVRTLRPPPGGLALDKSEGGVKAKMKTPLLGGA
jgi:hypothetical protein